MNWKFGGGVFAIASSLLGLYIKNKRAENSFKELSKQDIIVIMKKIRKQRYIVYKQIAVFALNIMQQMKNNINTNLIEQYINGPQSPLKVKKLFDQITENICKQKGCEVQEYELALQRLQNEPTIKQLIIIERNDYKNSLGGKLPNFKIKIPPSLTKELFVQIQNKITKLAYIQQVKIFKKLKEYSEVQLQTNPSLLQDLGNPQEQQQNILKEYNLQTQFEPASAIFKQAQTNFHSDRNFKSKIQKIELLYQNVLKKYTPKLQTKTITDHELNQLQTQILNINISV